jgi:hypothetical protein
VSSPIPKGQIRALAQQYLEKANAVTYSKMLEQENTKPIYASINSFVVTANSVVTSTTITADSDGDFQFTGITGSVTYAAGATYPSDGQLNVQITDQASGYKLTQGYVPFHLLVNPGFISTTVFAQRFYTTPFHFTLFKASTLQFDFSCTMVSYAATVNVLLEGKKVFS